MIGVYSLFCLLYAFMDTHDNLYVEDLDRV